MPAAYPQQLAQVACNPVCCGQMRFGAMLGHDRWVDVMKTTYLDDDDTLVIRLSEKPIAREVSQDWHTHVSYAADGTLVETVILDASKIGAWPLSIEHRQAA